MISSWAFPGGMPLFSGMKPPRRASPVPSAGITLLRSQLAAPLRKFCDSDYGAEFVAEALLNWTMAEKDFQEIYRMIGKLF